MLPPINWMRVHGKTSMVGLPNGNKNFEDMYNLLDSVPACEMDGDGHERIDRRTSCDGIVRAMHTRRAVKNVYRPN